MIEPDFGKMASLYSKARFKDVIPPVAGLPDCFTVVTACNPHGITIPDGENENLTASLATRLDLLGLSCFPVTGYDPDSTHGEPGFGVICGQETGVSLGKEFRQVAVFLVENAFVHLVSCGEGSEVIALKPWSAMCD